jgi:inner membrane protein
MDNLCHTLVGAACGEAGLKRRTRFGNATLMIAANIPDLDVLVFASDLPSVAFRRGWTHGALAQILLPVAMTAVLCAVDRVRPSRGAERLHAGWVLVLSYLGVISHVLLDLMNTYGIRLLMPFDGRWFYGDTLFIIDPWIWLALGAGILLARRRGRPQAARAALVVVALYVGAMVVGARAARDVVAQAWEAQRGGALRSLMVGPVPIFPLSRTVIVDTGPAYITGTFSWFPTRVTFDPEEIPKGDDDPRVTRARDARTVRAFLVWSRFPVWTVETTAGGAVVSVRDMRFLGRGRPFVQSATVP